MMEKITPYLTKFAQLVDGSNVDIPNKNVTEASFNATIANVITYTFGILGAISVIIITIAGIQYVISNGDPQKTAKAKNTILYAVIGLVVAILATALVNFVIRRVE